MLRIIKIGVIGDFNPSNETHVATNAAFGHSARLLKAEVNVKWLPTQDIGKYKLDKFDGFLCAPGSPYRSYEGALSGIRFARENDVPFMGTCGGCHHLIVEFARNVMGIADAEHAEEHPNARNLFVTPLTCSLVGKTEQIKILPDSRAYEVYGLKTTMERFYCNYGLNPVRRGDVEKAGLKVSGVDTGEDVRILELEDARYFFGTLFVPQAKSTPEQPHPMITSLLRTAQAG